MLDFFPFCSIIFLKNAENSYFFRIACLFMPWLMSHNSKILPKFKSLQIFLYHLWKKALRQFRSFSNARSPILGTSSKPSTLSHAFVYEHNPKFFRNWIQKQKSTFGLWKITYHTTLMYGNLLIVEIWYNFLYVRSCIKMYDKKFLVNGNCMIRSFVQPGALNKTWIIAYWFQSWAILKFGIIRDKLSWLGLVSQRLRRQVLLSGGLVPAENTKFFEWCTRHNNNLSWV